MKLKRPPNPLLFACGHPKKGRNIQRYSVRGRLRTRCRTCLNKYMRRYMKRRRKR